MKDPVFTNHAIRRWNERIGVGSIKEAWGRAELYGVETKNSRYYYDIQTDAIFVIQKKDNIVITILTKEQYMVNAQMTFGSDTRIMNPKITIPKLNKSPPQSPTEKTIKKLITNHVNEYMQKFVVGRGIVNSDRGMKETRVKLREMLAKKGYDIRKDYVGAIINEAIRIEEKRMRNSIFASLQLE